MRYKFTKTDLGILQALYAFPYMTVKQLTRLLYDPDSENYVGKRLKKLSETGEVERFPMYSNIQAGGNPFVYWIGPVGRHRLEKQGYSFKGWKRFPYLMKPFVSSDHFSHYMATTDFLIEATLIPDFKAEGLFHYFTLNRERSADVIPDGWLHLVSEKREYYFCIEVDMDTETDQQIRDKIGNLIYFVDMDEYAALYGDHKPLFVFWTPMGEKRSKKLVKLIEEKTPMMYMPEKASWFRVGSGELSPTMFFDTIWTIPNAKGKRQVVPLLFNSSVEGKEGTMTR